MTKVSKTMMTSPISTTLPISELTTARHYLAKCQQNLAETRAMKARVKDVVDRLLLDLAIEDHTHALLAALSWAWDAQLRMRLAVSPEVLRCGCRACVKERKTWF